MPEKPSAASDAGTQTVSNVTAVAGGGIARKSSGLVRDFSQVDNWIYNVIAINVVVGGALTFAQLQTSFPHASFWLPFLIAGLFCSCEAVAYALLTAAMPRSGGDYTFQSRIFGGAVATIFAFSAAVLVAFVVWGIDGFGLANVILGPFFSMLGATYHAHWLTSLGSSLGTPTGVFILGLISAVWFVVACIRGIRVYAWIQRWSFWPGLVLLVMFIIIMLFMSHHDWVNNLNSFMKSRYHISNAYQKTIRAGGTTDTSFSLSETISASVIAAFALIYTGWGVQQAGEIKRANSVRSNMRSILGAQVFSFLMLALIGALLVSRVGHNFLYAASNLYFSNSPKNPLPVPPLLGFLFTIAGNATIFIWLGLVMCFCWALTFYANNLGSTRVLLAMSFDRILPQSLGRVNRRLHSPVVAIVAFAVFGLPGLAIYAFDANFAAFTFGFFIVSITAFGVTTLAAAVFPYRRRSLFEASPAGKYRFLGIPVITIVGAAFVAFTIFADYEALTNSRLGVNGTKGLVFMGGVFVAAAVIYVVAKVYRRRADDFDLSMAYQELPVE